MVLLPLSRQADECSPFVAARFSRTLLSQAGVERRSENTWLYSAFRHSADGSRANSHSGGGPGPAGRHRRNLSARVLQQEHRIYPEAVRWFMEDRLKVSDNSVDVSCGTPAANANVRQLAQFYIHQDYR